MVASGRITYSIIFFTPDENKSLNHKIKILPYSITAQQGRGGGGGGGKNSALIFNKISYDVPDEIYVKCL